MRNCSWGDGHPPKAVGVDIVRLKVVVSDGIREVLLTNVFHVKKLVSNLFSVKTAAYSGYIVQFGKHLCWIKDSEN